MSAVPAERLRYAEELQIPEEVLEVFHNLTDKGAQDFKDELLLALRRAQQTADLRPVNDVIEAWYRSLLLVRKPGFEEAYEEAFEEDEPRTRGLRVDEVRERLGLQD